MSDIVILQETFDDGVEDLRPCVTNQAIRDWYRRFNGAIADANKGWRILGIDLRACALRAWSMRHVARMLARMRMSDSREVQQLQERDSREHGSPHGPSFESLVKFSRQEGATEDQAYEAIVEGARRTNAVVDQRFESRGEDNP